MAGEECWRRRGKEGGGGGGGGEGDGGGGGEGGGRERRVSVYGLLHNNQLEAIFYERSHSK